jgi:predicted dehydrogenase/nucleoside-diphosphate-sugar epimerase
MAIALQENAKLVAIADPEADPVKLHEILGSEVLVFQDGEELLQKCAPDIVHVCTPPGTHSALACLALSRGAHVYVEKPFALTSNDAVIMINMAKETGRRICAGHQLLYESPALRSHEFLKYIGKILYVESYFSFRPVRRAMDGRSTISPLDQLVDILPHPVYLLLHFLKGIYPNGEDIPVETQALEVSASGWVRGLFQCGSIAGNLVVTLEGRPVESYVRVVGTNGCLLADFVRGTVVALPGPGTSGISKVINPYSHAWQTATRTTLALSARVLRKQKSYPGLAEIIHAFYESVRQANNPPIRYPSIVETVGICEMAHQKLKAAEAVETVRAEALLKQLESRLPPVDGTKGGVLISGGTGFLGKVVASRIREMNVLTRVVSRSVPPASLRIPGVEYAEVDLSRNISPDLFKRITLVIHCAAETAGGKEAHLRNSIGATKNFLEATAKAGVTKFLHISSIAVLQSSRETGRPVDETTPLVVDSESKGPYVWGKVESELLVKEFGKKLGVDIRVVRPGPLVDYEAFEPPGRLGREVGRTYVYIGSKKSRLSLCDVRTVAKVICAYVDGFEVLPPELNLVEPDPPTRGELVSKLLRERPDLKGVGIPFFVLRAMSSPLKLLQRMFLSGRKPVDIYSAFTSETYDATLAAKIIRLAQ